MPTLKTPGWDGSVYRASVWPPNRDGPHVGQSLGPRSPTTAWAFSGVVRISRTYHVSHIASKL